MRGKTHVLVGAAVAVPFGELMGNHALLPAMAVGAIGSLLPDVDLPQSLAGRWFLWPVRQRWNGHFEERGRAWGRHTVWHRCETHSFVAGVIAGLLVVMLATATLLGLHARWGWTFPPALVEEGIVVAGVATILGYWSHLIVDVVNVTPQMLLWPFSRRRYRPSPIRGIPQQGLLGRMVEGLTAMLSLLAMFSMGIGQHL